MPWWGLPACLTIGFIAGVINTIAGGGSFLTLSLLLFIGLPATAANGTNRVGVLAQNISAVWGFHRAGVLEWSWALRASIPVCAGGLAGAIAALYVPDAAFRRLLAIAMIGMTIATFVYGAMAPARSEPASPSRPGIAGGLVAMGLYGGFLQAGIGFLSLAITSLAGIDLVRGNGIKALVVLLLTLLTLLVFAGTGNVDWLAGLTLGTGNALGSLVGVRLAVLRGQRWLEYAVSIALVVFAVLLWVGG